VIPLEDLQRSISFSHPGVFSRCVYTSVKTLIEHFAKRTGKSIVIHDCRREYILHTIHCPVFHLFLWMERGICNVCNNLPLGCRSLLLTVDELKITTARKGLRSDLQEAAQ
jgi:hypothetical protein